MSSGSSGRYRSRLFKFVHRQSRRFQQQWERASQNLQASASWVAAVGLYPLLLIFQSTRSTTKQLDRAVQQTLLQLSADENSTPSQTPPAVDTPIQQVLLFVDALSSEEAPHLLPKPEPTVKGILGFLMPWRQESAVVETRHVASFQKSGGSLLATSYQPLATNKTRHPSIQGIASQLSSQSLVLVTAQNEILDILTPQQQQKLQERIIAAVADYWRYQRLAHSLGGQIGSQESGVVETLHATSLLTLDRTVAEVESNLMPVSKMAITLYQNSWQLVQQIQTHWSTSLSKSRRPAINPNDSQSSAQRILTLIWAAVDFFFRDRGRKHLIQTALKPDLNPSRLTPNLAEVKNFPLNSRQLYGVSQEQQLPQRHAVRLPSSGLGSTQQSSCQPSPNPDLEDPWLSENDLFSDPLAVSQISPSPRKQKTSSISTPVSRQNTQVQPSPDWIETHATMIGYVKHPLEQLLAWLDQIMLWLEEVLLKVWQWLQIGVRGEG